jgi:hypothetical protein
MTGAGWFIMLVSITSVMSLLAFSLYKIFSLPTIEAEEHIQTQPFIDTHDTVDAD